MNTNNFGDRQYHHTNDDTFCVYGNQDRVLLSIKLSGANIRIRIGNADHVRDLIRALKASIK